MAACREIIKSAAAQLHAAGIEDAAHDARALFLYVSGMSLTDFLLRQNEEMPESLYENYVNLIRLRSDRIPLQHLTGTQWFYGLAFQVNAHVLIPRPETEVLVETALAYCRRSERRPDQPEDAPVWRQGGIRPDHPAGASDRRRSGCGPMPDAEYAAAEEPLEILDMCTGSGCILLSLLHELPDACGTGVDFSREALDVAQENAKRLGLTRESTAQTEAVLRAEQPAAQAEPAARTEAAPRAESAGRSEAASRTDPSGRRLSWIQSDMFADVTGRFDLIVSNPPYIRREEIAALAPEVRDHDPRQALDGGADGLDFYRILASESPAYLKKGGRLILEIGADQALPVRKMLAQAGFADIAVRQDLNGLDRVVCAGFEENRNV